MVHSIEIDTARQIDRLRRQFFQVVDPDQLALPAVEILKLPDVQAEIFVTIFNEKTCSFPSPANNYKLRVLKKIVNALEQSVVNPEEDEISDDLTTCLARLLAEPDKGAPYHRSYGHVTYTAPSLSTAAPTVTVLEARALLAFSGDTGWRTWEAALLLGTYLFSAEGRHFVRDKNVLELGAGTGFLSILCAKHLSALHVLATDGSRASINDIGSNIFLNGLEGSDRIHTALLTWGQTLNDQIVHRDVVTGSYDLVVGADVTYDIITIRELISTLRDLSNRFTHVKILIAATVRNENTLDAFIDACDRQGFNVEDLDIEIPREDEQVGFFFPTFTVIRVFLITRIKATDHLFAA